MRVGLKFKNKKIEIEVKRCNFFQRFTGLMFSRREKAFALLFDFKKPVKIAIHSWFVFFNFLAIWLDEENKIIKIKKVKPFSSVIFPEKKFVKLIEIPLNKKYKNEIKSLVGDAKDL
jgi:uncharacterized membrane protein (UPF0127 family)